MLQKVQGAKQPAAAGPKGGAPKKQNTEQQGPKGKVSSAKKDQGKAANKRSAPAPAPRVRSTSTARPVPTNTQIAQNVVSLYIFISSLGAKTKSREMRQFTTFFGFVWYLSRRLENHATTFPVTCLGHVRVLYILARGIEKHSSRDKFLWRCNTVAREQLGTKRKFEQFEHLSSFTFYFLCIPIKAVVPTLRGAYFVLLELWCSQEQVFSP